MNQNKLSLLALGSSLATTLAQITLNEGSAPVRTFGLVARAYADGADPAAPAPVVDTTRDLGKIRTLTLRLVPGGGYAAILSPTHYHRSGEVRFNQFKYLPLQPSDF